jgi:DNA-binding NarL/FixJ family response regulator
MSFKVLIASFEDAADEIDAAGLRSAEVIATNVAWEELMASAEITCDAVLLIDSPTRDNLALIRHLGSIAPSSKIIVSAPHSCANATAYLQAGVSGLLDALHPPEKLAGILRRVGAGEYYLDQNIAQLLAMRQIKKLLAPFATLNSREYDVFCMLAEGNSLQTIAGQLGISAKTVSNCQSQLKAKLGMESRDAIVAFAKKHSLIA